MLTRDACRTTSESFGVRRIACIVPVWATTQRTLLTCGAPLPRGEGDLCGMPQYVIRSLVIQPLEERRRRQASRLMPAKNSPGNPAPATGPGTLTDPTRVPTTLKLLKDRSPVKRLRGLIVGVAPAQAALPQ